MLLDDETIGVVVVDSSESVIATVNGVTISMRAALTSGVGGKHNKGGQSQRRFERLHDEGVKWFVGRVAVKMNHVFLEPGSRVTKILVAGSGSVKDMLESNKHLDYRIVNRIIGSIDIGYNGEPGVREAIHKAKGLLEDLEYTRQRDLVQGFMAEIGKDSGLASYGNVEISKDVEDGRIQLLLVLDDVDDSVVHEAMKRGVTIETISSSTEDGSMLRGFGGIVGIRRF